MSDNIIGICPTCYLVVKSDQPNVQEIGSGERVSYHRECEPNRMKFMRENEKKWEDQGSECKKLREEWHITVSELSEYLNVSESKLRKFEVGKPVTHARLLSMAYIMYFKLLSHSMESSSNK